MPMPNFLNPAVVQGGSSPYAQQAEAERLMGLAQMMQRQQMTPGSNGFMNIVSAVLPQIASSYMAKKGEKQYDASMQAQAGLRQQYEIDRIKARETAKTEASQQLMKARYDQAIKMGYPEEIAREIGFTGKPPPKPKGGYTTAGGFIVDQATGEARPIEGYAAQQAAIARAGRDPRPPSAQQEVIGMLRALGASEEQIKQKLLGGGSGTRGTPEEREGAKLEANSLKEAQDRALAARKTLETLARVEELQGKGISTGPLDQYLPGKNRQMYDALSADLNLSTLRQNFGGNPTEGERAANLETLPATNKYEDVNKQLLAKIRQQAEQTISEYEAQRGGSGLPTIQGAAPAAPGSSAGAPMSAEPTAVNPQTGEKIVFRNGQWVPA